MIAKYLATSLAIEKVVRAPRVISNCLPISTTSMIFVGFESRSTMLPASRAAWVPALIAIECQLGLGSRFGAEVVNAGFVSDRRGGQRIVAGDHHGTQTHHTQPG